MKTSSIIYSLLFLFSFLPIKAQVLNGFNIESNNTRIIVLLNGQQMCEPTTSCFIANLKRGTYNLQVFRAEDMNLQPQERNHLYKKNIIHDGVSVKHIQVGHREDDLQGGYYPHAPQTLISNHDFQNLIKSIKKVNFEEDKKEIIEILPSNILFTSSQCKEITSLLKFDVNRVHMLIKLYPRTIDKASFHTTFDVLNFSSSQEEVRDYIKKYNSEHNI